MEIHSGYLLVDIPASLTPSSFTFLLPTSSVAPTQSRNPPEPKKKNTAWPQAEDMKKLHEQYGILVEIALQSARDDGVTEWCKPRQGRTEPEDTQDIRQWQEMFNIMNSFGNKEENNEIMLSTEESEFRLEEIYGQIVSNPNGNMNTISILLETPQKFYVPAQASFILDTFPSASSALTSYTLNNSRFDLIILDPPWHNKAVSRLKTKKHLSYNTMKDILTEIPPVGNWLAPDGIIGLWCTNNLKMINKVKTILFRRWGVELVTEWVWLKVTSHGEPVVDINSSFRKPYEILLLARKRSTERVIDIPERKVVIAVPGYHSQKPSLKGPFDKIFSDKYRACELYARNLTEGWMSVGDECLKFMREDYWHEIPQETPLSEGNC